MDDEVRNSSFQSVRVQIREDLALDSSPMLGLSKRLAPLYPSNTPFQAKQPIKPKVLATVEPTSVLYPGTMVNRFQGKTIANLLASPCGVI